MVRAAWGCSAPIPATHAYLAGYRDNQLVRGTDGGFRKIGDRYIVEANGLHVTEAKRKGSAECLWDIYGGTLTDKGYRMILTCLADKGFAPSNVAGFLHLQHAVAPHMWPGHEGDLRGSR